ncbi:MAG: DUF2437 domain-containing protein, partial [Dehalococcoidia bacterium]|nr:DUF2437 domain-containing protein [Dehalococcoidia bacterium]
MDRYVRFARPDGSTAAGLLEGDRIAVIAEPFWERTERTGEELALADVRLLPPCEPRSIVCVGLNYASHLGGQPGGGPGAGGGRPRAGGRGKNNRNTRSKE